MSTEVLTTDKEISDAKFLTDFRLMEVMKFVIANNINKVADEKTFCLSIGYTSPRNLQLINKGTQHFKISHISNACAVYKINADFLLNKNCHKMFADPSNETPIFRLKVAAAEVEIYLKELEEGLI